MGVGRNNLPLKVFSKEIIELKKQKTLFVSFTLIAPHIETLYQGHCGEWFMVFIYQKSSYKGYNFTTPLSSPVYTYIFVQIVLLYIGSSFVSLFVYCSRADMAILLEGLVFIWPIISWLLLIIVNEEYFYFDKLPSAVSLRVT